MATKKTKEQTLTTLEATTQTEETGEKEYEIMMNDIIPTPYGDLVYRGEPLLNTAYRLYQKMINHGEKDFSLVLRYLPIPPQDFFTLLEKKEIQNELQNIRNTKMFQEAEKVSEKILTLPEVDEEGKVDVQVLSQKRQHAEFILERLGRDKGYSKNPEVSLQQNNNTIQVFLPERKMKEA
jgi:hypothetical protein